MKVYGRWGDSPLRWVRKAWSIRDQCGSGRASRSSLKFLLSLDFSFLLSPPGSDVYYSLPKVPLDLHD